MTKPRPTPDRIAGSKARRRIHVDGEINTVLFPGIRKFVFAILDAGYSPETVSSVTEKAIQDWQEYHQGWGESTKSRKAREWANQQKCSPESHFYKNTEQRTITSTPTSGDKNAEN